MNSSPMLLVLALVAGTGSAQGGLTWMVNPANGHAYALTPPMTWTQGEALAVQLGGHLTTVRNAAEHSWLVQTFGVGAPEDTRIWIGMTDEMAEGTWLWSSGEPVSYTNWGLWEPDNNGNQDYAGLWLIPTIYGGGWRWCDEGPNNRASIIELTPALATFATFGAGCPGSQGTPVLAPAAGSLPRLGSTLQLELSNLPQGLIVVLGALGFSNSTWGSNNLPLDLGFTGMPGCTQYVSLDVTYFMLSVTGTTTWSIPIPALPWLSGYMFFVQALVPDSPANAFGATVTNAGAATIGA